MSWSRGIALLSTTRTGRSMLGGAFATSTGVGILLNRKAHVSARLSLASGAVLGLGRRVDDIPAEAPVAWAYGVARGCLANAVRGAARQERLVQRLAAEPAPPTQGAEHEALDAALAGLPETDREILQLWAWE